MGFEILAILLFGVVAGAFLGHFVMVGIIKVLHHYHFWF